MPELRGVHTQARRLEGVEATVRDAIALFLNVRPDSFDVRIVPVLPRELQEKVGRVRKVGDEAEVLQRQATMVSAEVAADLVERAHLTVRDAGRVLGFPTSVSHNCSRLVPAPRGEAISHVRESRDGEDDRHTAE